MPPPFSRSCRAFVLAVAAVGAVCVLWAVADLTLHPPHPAWCLLAILALLSGPLSIRIPSMQATISVSEGFIFSTILLFGPAAATVIAVIDGLAVSLWSTQRTLMRTLFGVAEPALSVAFASLLFYRLAGIDPLFSHSVAVGQLILPLIGLTIVYFGLNIGLVATVMWLDTGSLSRLLLRQHLLHVVLDFSVCVALATALAEMRGNVTLAAGVVFVPTLLGSYISSRYMAGRVEDADLHLSELKRLYHSTVETLAMAIDAKDQVTHGHIRRVQALTTELARRLGASDRDVQAIEAAALLHDLGKLAVPEHILNKPAPLTQAEYEEMKKHAEIGASILSAIDFPYPVVPLVRHHHENWDGTGYPQGLSGTDIPLGARILSVIDCYDALTSDRPYRRRLSHADAMEIIRSRSGRMYDPSVVEAFTALGPLRSSDDVPAASPAQQTKAHRVITAVNRPLPPGAGRSVRRATSDRVAQFLGTVRGTGWDAAGQAVCVFVPLAVAESVAVLFRFDDASQQLVAAGLRRTSDARLPETVALGSGISGWVASTREKILNSDAELDLGELAAIAHPPLRMCVSYPILDDDALIGVLTAYAPYAFSETDRLFLNGLAEQLPPLLRADSLVGVPAASPAPRYQVN